MPATQQVYKSLGKLIKLCDEVMLSDDAEECASLSSENVREIVDLLEEAIRVNLKLLYIRKIYINGVFLSRILQLWLVKD